MITTPRGILEPELEAGVTYIHNNAPDTITKYLKQVIEDRRYECTAEKAALRTYGPAAVSEGLTMLLEQVTGMIGRNHDQITPELTKSAAQMGCLAVRQRPLSKSQIPNHNHYGEHMPSKNILVTGGLGAVGPILSAGASKARSLRFHRG